MRMRPLVLSLLLGTTSALVLSGCSGKPENSPVIRKKFAEVDKMQETITTLVADNTALQDQVTQLTKENSELRTFLPDADGTPILEKLTALESRLSKVEGMAGDRMVAQAASTTSAPAPSAPKSTNLDSDETHLAGTKSTNVLSQQELTKPSVPVQKSASAKPATSNFKEKTKAQPSAPVAKPAPAAAPKTQGSYHVIETGDSLESIAKKHGVSVADLVKANRLPSEKIRLARGQKIYVPAH